VCVQIQTRNPTVGRTKRSGRFKHVQATLGHRKVTERSDTRRHISNCKSKKIIFINIISPNAYTSTYIGTYINNNI